MTLIAFLAGIVTGMVLAGSVMAGGWILFLQMVDREEDENRRTLATYEGEN